MYCLAERIKKKKRQEKKRERKKVLYLIWIVGSNHIVNDSI